MDHHLQLNCDNVAEDRLLAHIRELCDLHDRLQASVHLFTDVQARSKKIAPQELCHKAGQRAGLVKVGHKHDLLYAPVLCVVLRHTPLKHRMPDVGQAQGQSALKALPLCHSSPAAR
jgi:hypothetical protein